MMLKRRAQWLVGKGLKAPKDRMVSTAAEALDPFVAHPQAGICSLIEIEGEPRFGSRTIFVDQPTVDPHDFQLALFQVMGFFRVQSQDLPRDLAFCDDQSRDEFSSKAPQLL